MSEISDITIGYSKTGVSSYSESVMGDIQSNVIDAVIVGELDGLNTSIQNGWKGEACNRFITKLGESTVTLQSVLRKMHTAFKETMDVQADTFREQDDTMAEEMDQINFLGDGEVE